MYVIFMHIYKKYGKMSDWRDLFLGTTRSAALTNRRGGKNMLTTRKARGGNEYRKSAPIQITKKKREI